jgi:hypothetical protein
MKQVLNDIPLLSGEIATTLRDTKFKNATFCHNNLI